MAHVRSDHRVHEELVAVFLKSHQLLLAFIGNFLAQTTDTLLVIILTFQFFGDNFLDELSRFSRAELVLEEWPNLISPFLLLFALLFVSRRHYNLN